MNQLVENGCQGTDDGGWWGWRKEVEGIEGIIAAAVPYWICRVLFQSPLCKLSAYCNGWIFLFVVSEQH